MVTHEFPHPNPSLYGMRAYTNSLLVRHGFANLKGTWTPDDDEASYKRNKRNGLLSSRFDDPSVVQYSYNSLGYRTEEFDTFKDNNFIVCFGCSYTEGTGLNNSEVWHHLIGEKYNMPVMNLGIGGSGSDILQYNVMQYVRTKMPKPKLAIFQWSHVYRKLFVNQSHMNEPYSINSVVPNTFDENESDILERIDYEYIKSRYITYTELAYFEKYCHYTTANLLMRSIGCPVFNFSFEDDIESQQNPLFAKLQMEKITSPISSTARDGMHPGVKQQEQFAKRISPFVEGHL